jgi:uncharacterized protein YggE
MVFIHPTILRDIKTENLSTSQKYKYMRALELDIVGEGSYLLDEDMPVLPELNISVMKPENTSNESNQN